MAKFIHLQSNEKEKNSLYQQIVLYLPIASQTYIWRTHTMFSARYSTHVQAEKTQSVAHSTRVHLSYTAHNTYRINIFISNTAPSISHSHPTEFFLVLMMCFSNLFCIINYNLICNIIANGSISYLERALTELLILIIHQNYYDYYHYILLEANDEEHLYSRIFFGWLSGVESFSAPPSSILVIYMRVL